MTEPETKHTHDKPPLTADQIKAHHFDLECDRAARARNARLAQGLGLAAIAPHGYDTFSKSGFRVTK